MSLKKAIGYTFIYICVNAFFGLAPLWIILEGSLCKFTVDAKEIIKEGVIMFFCIAIIGGISFDFCVADISQDKALKYVTIATPLVLLVFVSINFAQLNFNPSSTGYDFSKLNFLQWILIVISICYSIFFKTLIFINDKKEAGNE